MDIKYVCYWFHNSAFTKNAKQTQYMLTPEIKTHLPRKNVFIRIRVIDWEKVFHY
jgi:hypothetical protein